jgi:hypothetical protein
MKIYFKVLILFAVFFTFAIFQGCLEKQENYCYFYAIEDFDIQTNWNNKDTIKIEDFKIIFLSIFGDYMRETICKNNNLISKLNANNDKYYADGEIKSIDIYSNNDIDSLHLRGLKLNDLFFLTTDYDFIKIESVISDIQFPILAHRYFNFRFYNFSIDTIQLHQFTIIYEEIDGTKITKVLPEVYISPN